MLQNIGNSVKIFSQVKLKTSIKEKQRVANGLEMLDH